MLRSSTIAFRAAGESLPLLCLNPYAIHHQSSSIWVVACNSCNQLVSQSIHQSINASTTGWVKGGKMNEKLLMVMTTGREGLMKQPKGDMTGQWGLMLSPHDASLAHLTYHHLNQETCGPTDWIVYCSLDLFLGDL
jgi:hypothetical protein